jgi:hypothetical protein
MVQQHTEAESTAIGRAAIARALACAVPFLKEVCTAAANSDDVSDEQREQLATAVECILGLAAAARELSVEATLASKCLLLT